MKFIKKSAAILLCMLMLSVFAGVAATAADGNAYRSNSHWVETTRSDIESKYNNGEKFIVDFYRTTCGNSQSVGTNVITRWMDDYSYTVYGVDVDTQGIPSWGWAAAGSSSISLPLVCFVNNKNVTAYSGATKAATDGMNSTFYSFTGYTPIADPSAVYSYNVTYHQTEARSMLSRINSLRTGGNAWYWNSDNTTKTVLTNLSALQYDYELERAAMQRAAELVARYSHNRPNDGSPWDLYSYSSAGENIAYGYTSADSVQTAWEEENDDYSGQGHRRNMLNSKITAVGIACVEYNGRKYWVQEFRSPTSNAAYTAPNDSLTAVSVEIMDKYIASKTVSASPSSLSLKVGGSASLPTVSQNFTMNVSPRNTFTSAVSVSWASSNTSIVKVSGSSAVAVGGGTASLIGTYDGGKTISVSVSVTADTYTVSYNANGATGGTAPANQTKTAGVTLTLATNTGNLVKTGYAIDGWATSAAGAKVYNLGGSYTANAAATLYAHWTPNTYTVKFNGNGATSGSMSNQTFTYDAAQNLTANAFKRAYTVNYNYNGATGGNSTASAAANASFNGWATSASGSKVYNDKASVKNLAASGTYELYANWTLNTVTLPTPSRTGYIFDGWYTSSSFATLAGVGGASYKPTASITLYAKWTAKPAATLTSISVKTMPSKTSYYMGESFNSSGLTLTARYSDGSTLTVSSGFTYTGFNSTSAGTKTITVTYEGKTTTFTVTVIPTLSGISVKTMPAKTTYTVGESFSQSGLTLTATYSDGSTQTVSSGFTCSGFSSTAAGTKTITVTYQGKTTTFKVTVNEKPRVRAVSVSDMSVTYKKTGKLTPVITADQGAKYTVTYYSSAPQIVSVDSDGNLKGLKSGSATVTVTVRDDQGNTVQDTCKVKVGLAVWQVLIKIFLFGWIWY